MLQPILADIDSIIGLIVVAVWILGWILKVISGQNQKGPPVANRPRPAARPRDEKLQDEIDIFIQEVGPKKQTRRPPAKATGQQRPQSTPGKAAARAPQRRPRPGEEIATRHVADSEKKLGTGVKQHLQQHMAERVSRETAAHLQHNVDKSVAEHLGQRSGESQAKVPATAADAAKPPQEGRYAELFRSQANLRQAMVVNLILSPPPGRKPRPSR